MIVNILFVDDEPMALRAIQRTLQIQSRDWNMQFCTSAEDAWALINNENIDIVITDMRMPDVDGSMFLLDVRNQKPETVRVVLSGFKDDESAIRSTDSAHRFLSKPITSQDLVRQIISTTESMPQDLLKRRVVNGTTCLYSPVSVIEEFRSVVNNPTANTADVAAVVQTDPALTAKVLQLSNSAFFGTLRQVTDLSRCISTIGITTLRTLVERNDFARSLPSDDPRSARVEEIRQHAVATGTERRASVATDSPSDDEYFGGLLHVAGSLLEMQDTEKSYVCGCEDNETLELGLSLLQLWGVPTSVINTVRTGSGLSQ